MSETTTSEAVASGGGEAVSSAAPSVESTTPVDVSTTESPTVAETPAEAPKKSWEDSLLDAYNKAQGIPARDAQGRFASATPKPVSPEPEAPPVEAAVEGTEPTAQDPALDQALPPVEAPGHLTADQKAKFATLPR